jgi:hypothetical protein
LQKDKLYPVEEIEVWHKSEKTEKNVRNKRIQEERHDNKIKIIKNERDKNRIK